MRGFFSEKETTSISRPDGKTYSCVSCGLASKSEHPKLRLQGNFQKGIMIVGSCSSPEEDRVGKLWRGKIGNFLQSELSRFGIDLYEDCLSINAIGCVCEEITPYNIDCCRKNVIKAIKEKKPKLIILLGKSAVISVIGGRWREDMGGIEKWRGWQIPDQEFESWICPMYHPSDCVNDNLGVTKIIWKKDLENALRCLNKKVPIFRYNITLLKPDELGVLSEIKSDLVSFDYETTGIKPHEKGHKIFSASIAFDNKNVFSFLIPEDKQSRKPLEKILINPNIRKMAHNMKFELAWSLVRWKLEVKNMYWDSMIAAHVIDNRQDITRLKFLTYTMLGVPDYASEISPYLKSGDKNGNSFNSITKLLNIPGGIEKLLTYGAMDSIAQYRISEIQMKIIQNDSNLSRAYDLFHQGTLALFRGEQHGLRVDEDLLLVQKNKISNEIKLLEDDFYDTTFFHYWNRFSSGKININSNEQLANFLYKGKGIKPLKITDKGKGATDEEALQMLNIPELNSLLKIRKLKKIKETYLEGYSREQVRGILHPFFNLHNVISYRSSSSNPNFQNIPKRDEEAKKIIRSVLFARPGNQLMEVDFSGLEVSIAACYHKDPVMIDYLVNKKDMHGDMAKQIFCLSEFDKHIKGYSELRYVAKNGFVFAQFYGDYYKNNAYRICQKTEMPTIRRWKGTEGIKLPDGTPISQHLVSNGIKGFDDFCEHLKFIEKDFWGNRFKVYGRWKEKWWNEYLRNGYVDSFTGFRFQGIMRKNEVINYPIQGAAFHCLLWSYIRLNRIIKKKKYKSKIIGQIHDAMVIDVVPDELMDLSRDIKYITTRELIETWDWINVPLDIEAEICQPGGSWADIEEFKEFLKIKI